jgi:hypothetical protein
MVSHNVPVQESSFITGLAALQSLKTHGGAGLKNFLEDNLGQFEDRVATVIRNLAKEVFDNAT